MPTFRSVVSVLLRDLGDFSLHPQGRPAGGLRPPSAGGVTLASRAGAVSRFQEGQQVGVMVSACVVGMPCGKPL